MPAGYIMHVSALRGLSHLNNQDEKRQQVGVSFASTRSTGQLTQCAAKLGPVMLRGPGYLKKHGTSILESMGLLAPCIHDGNGVYFLAASR